MEKKKQPSVLGPLLRRPQAFIPIATAAAPAIITVGWQLALKVATGITAKLIGDEVVANMKRRKEERKRERSREVNSRDHKP